MGELGGATPAGLVTRPMVLLAACSLALLGSGCANPDAPGIASDPAGSPGEPAAPAPPRPSDQAAASPQRSPSAAVEQFAVTYGNWSYRTLAAGQRRLAAIAVGGARLQALQAAAAGRIAVLARARVWNRCELLGVAPDRARRRWWILVTREQTGGRGEYEHLPPSLHVTLARPVRVRDGWAIEQWQPQD